MKQSMKRYYSLPLLLIIFMTSCRVGRDYQTPALELPAQFEAKTFADTSSIADIEWRKFFTDPTLQSLIDRGIAYNHDMLVAMKRVDIAQQQLIQSRALQMPEVNLQLTGQFNRPSNNSLSGLSAKNFLGKTHIENYMTVATLSWEADIWGKIRAQKEVALTGYLQSYEAKKAVQTRLVANIAEGYFNLLMLDRQLEIAKRNLLLNDSFVMATRLLKDAGLVNMLAVQQAEAQKQATALLIPQLEQSIALQENNLQLLTGQLPGPLQRNKSLNDLVLPDALVAGLPAAMVARRPDVRVNEMALMMANAQVGIAQANMYPALNITAGGGLEAFKASNWFNVPGSLFGLAAGAIAQPIFNRRALRTQFEVAGLQREQAVIQFRQSVLQAVTEVSNVLVQIEKTKQQEEIVAEQSKILQSAIVNAQLLFKSDMANYLEVITAQSNALQAQLNLTAVQRQRWSAVVELYRSLGGGWK